MYKTTPLLDEWIRQNNDLVTKWKKQKDANALRKDQELYNVRCLSLEFHKLLTKIQGASPLADFTELEFTVMYNASVFSIALSEFSKVELLIGSAIDKILQISRCTSGSSDHLLFWRKVSEKMRMHPNLNFCFGQLFCLQWIIWLATQAYHIIREIEKELSLFDMVSTENKRNGELCESLLLILEPKELVELLRICTLIEQGAQRLSEGQYLEALNDMKKATDLPGPRALLASTHLISGSCFVQMKRLQIALVCFRKALETDCHCVSALYQSMLIYRQLGNKEAEIKALELLHSGLNVTHTLDYCMGDGQLISSSLLLSSPTLKNLLTVPSALTLLHSLALRCVHYGRVSEGVEHYLDLLAFLHTDQEKISFTVEVPALPRLPDLYLEAAATMLMVQRPADCIALCDEVVGTTLPLLPEKLVLEESYPEPETEPSYPCVNLDNGAMVLWVGAAHLLQGHCYLQFKDWKQAITHYTRCIDLLIKVQFKNKGCQPLIPSTDMGNNEQSKLLILQRLKAFSFAGRGICFAQTDQMKEALRDLHLSLHAFPESGFAGQWCGEVLWRLGRTDEAASYWKNGWSFTADSSKDVCLYLLEPPTNHLMNPLDLQKRMKDLGFEEDKSK